MTSIGTPFSSSATRVLLCGSGELGKEVVIDKLFGTFKSVELTPGDHQVHMEYRPFF